MSKQRRPATRKILSIEQLSEAAEQVAVIADRQGIEVALVGGFALQLHGSPRLTSDIDFASAKLLRGLPAGERLSFGGRETEAPNGVPLDLIVRSDKYKNLYDAAIAHSYYDDRYRNPDVPIVLPEYLVAMKMVAGRPKDEIDLKFLLDADDVVDLKAARKIVEKFLGPYAVDDLERVIDEVEWEKTRKGK